MLDDLREACAEVARRARYVRINHDILALYAGDLPPRVAERLAAPPDPEAELLTSDREALAAFWMCLGAINFGSGWFPSLRKRPGRTGYFTVAIGLRERFAGGAPLSVDALRDIAAGDVARMLDQEDTHPLMSLFACSLRDLGQHVASEYAGSFASVVDAAEGSAVELVARLSAWSCFADSSHYGELTVPFLKRAQLTAADLHRAGVAELCGIGDLTMFADNLVPHVLRVDSVLEYHPDLVARIERGELIDHGSPAEVEIRACALHAVEILAALLPGTSAAAIDETLWNRGQERRYATIRRHRTRCTAY